MTGLREIFAELGISQYLPIFVDQGFDSWDTILDITESDFDALGVKLGHRRKIQRRIANSRGLSADRALASPARHTPTDDRTSDDAKGPGARGDSKDGSSGLPGAKRKYRRHPKPDENAPERPPSAYVIFSNAMREELKGQQLSFTEIAKLVGENWQNLSPEDKEPYEQQATTAKEKYNAELVEYKKTSQYTDYQQYLADFKARQANAAHDGKRPKLEAQQSHASNGTASSGASLHSVESSTGRMRVESSASSTSQWPLHDNLPSPSLTASKVIPTGPSSHVSSSLPSPTVLPGYRDSIFSGAPHTLASREAKREDPAKPQQLPRISSIVDRRLSNPSLADAFSPNGIQHHLRTAASQTHPPPLLTSESTNRSTESSSTNSSSYLSPRTPLEPAIDRPLTLPSLPHSVSINFDSQLASRRLHSSSPHNAGNPVQNLPPSKPLTVDISTSMPPLRGYGNVGPVIEGPDPRICEFASPDDHSLDPVSALIRAGEIVNRSSRNGSSW